MPRIKRIIVCGGRKYADHRRVFDTLDVLDAEDGPILMVIEGGAGGFTPSGDVGADYLAGRWADRRQRIHIRHPAQWATNGDAAGPIRNAAMLDWRPDAVVAFQGGKGTANMVMLAEMAGILVIRA